MKPLFSQQEFNLAKSTDKLLCQCYNCNKKFTTTKNNIRYELNHNRGRVKFCSQECNNLFNNPKNIVKCLNWNISFHKTKSNIRTSPNHFCSKSCATTYNNKNKTHGNRRSKLESWIENKLLDLYPSLDFHFNRKDTIGSELDIYIPSLNLAFELNGIFHYEPIYGSNKLNQIKENDISKSKACHEAKIDLCVIDTSQQKYVKESTSQKYLDIIINIIKERLTF